MEMQIIFFEYDYSIVNYFQAILILLKISNRHLKIIIILLIIILKYSCELLIIV